MRWTRRNPIATVNDGDNRYLLAGEPAPDMVLVAATSTSMTAAFNTYVHTGAAATYTLPLSNSVPGMAVKMANRGTGTVVIARSGTDPIRGSSNVTSLLCAPQMVRYLVSDGSSWFLVPNPTAYDTEFKLFNSDDRTKTIVFDASAISTGTVRTFTLPDASGTLETQANKNVANGYAGLDANGKVAPAQNQTVTVSAATSGTVPTGSGVFVFTGGTSANWTLPPIAGNTGMVLKFRNRGTATFSFTRAGTDQIINSFSSVTFVAVAPSTTVEIVNDGTNWTTTSTVAVKDSDFWITNAADRTKVAVLSAAGQSTGQTRTHTLPDFNSTLAGRVAVPASATATGTAGMVAWDAAFFYVCTAANTWVRTALATW